ncbi:carboxyl transferase domain-containing protein [Tsukamurella sp. 8F]|uniref:acyl-CoA carboxylase subunit beta n=1 Tax=unclassified Tsukamurella TaxID=2633480 RepID=UPI0023BA3D60|nr:MULTISPECIES: carboxyl transferase domain-containing protein [unclassified Tsukamurella]MDF0531343.1 carboxyl transferase domain-containing protein [Tsukamurella sp. 8J]MDF0588549.1 carboxyl transferase domain-containing protein [Tsukamurella sp. 8F]
MTEDTESLVEKVRAAYAAVTDEARADKVAKQHARGRQTARERVAQLANGGFYEFGALAGPGPAQGGAAPLVAPGDGVVTGIAYIDGRPVALAAFDFTVLGGSNGATGMAKLERCAERALLDEIPLVMLMDGGGHRMQEALDSRLAAPGSRLLMRLADLSGHVPLVAAMMGPGFGAPANLAACCDFVAIVRGVGTIGMSSAPLVQAATGEELTNEEIGGADVQAPRGVVDVVADDENEALDAIRAYLSYLPPSGSGTPVLAAGPHEPGDAAAEIDTLVPASMRQAYDVVDVLEALSDRDTVFELKRLHAPNIVTAFARIGGRPVGFVANQPRVHAGALDSAACEKAAHFVAVCDAFGLPLVVLIDLPGFLVGASAEESGLVRRSARLGYELANATVPRFVVTTRKAYGAAYIVMGGGRSIEADLSLAWPTAEICAIPIESAVDLAFRGDYENAPDPQARRADLITLFQANVDPLLAADGFGIDDIVLPSATRGLLIEALGRVRPRRPLRVPHKRRSISPI